MDLSDDKENHNQLTASVRFQDALSPKNNDATPSFLKELEESKEYDRAGNIVDDQVDVPDRLTKSLGVKSVVDDLQRFSVHVGQQIMQGSGAGERFEGPLWVRSRPIFGRWKKFFGSIAVHNQFGPVLFMFSFDHRGGIRLRDSVLIVLTGAQVRSGRSITSSQHTFKIKTDRKKWLFSCRDLTKRDHWIQELSLMSAM
uniref:PH domain-containing protein n=1 Tax=Rhodosorus marinus TaxID=101924 RepID=A0A7S3A7G4_9RHOD|mmetsp:Transcript_614/g.1312  ORF Transcript_614/g.1312 Transcript_614/m.1312 type:complete len:199 (+) Transcript_614:606-1202(+)